MGEFVLRIRDVGELPTLPASIDVDTIIPHARRLCATGQLWPIPANTAKYQGGIDLVWILALKLLGEHAPAGRPSKSSLPHVQRIKPTKMIA